MGELDGKVAIVSGSVRGIGRAIAERLAAGGAAVVVSYAHAAGDARQAVRAIERAGGRAIAVRADVGRLDGVRRLFAAADGFGGVDIVVANAGVVLGTFFTLREAARRVRDGGRIITLSAAAKILSLVRVLAPELVARSVTANIVFPGVGMTPTLSTPAGVADVVAFLVSPSARWLTAQNIQASGI
jgi:3-oxoacyl-[acyl-carrier protein] reductase